MKRLLLCLLIALITLTTTSVTLAAPPPAYLISAARYLNIQKEHGNKVKGAMAGVQSHETSTKKFRGTVKIARAETNGEWDKNYSKTINGVPASYAEIHQNIQQSHELREAAYKEWLDNSKYKDPAKVAKAYKNFNSSLEYEGKAFNYVIDALKTKM